MSLRLIVTLFLLNSIVLFSQEKTTKHTIVKGETISSIAEKYDVKQSAIFKLNPNAKNLLKLNSILLIPVAPSKNTNTKSKVAANYSAKEHEVLAKETLYGIAKQYGISLKELNELNPTLESTGLKIGQKIIIPSNASSTEVAVAPQVKKVSQKPELVVTPQVIETKKSTTEQTTIEVLPKESKYSIARKYGITVKELDNANPTIGAKALRVGQKIIIPGNGISVTEVAVVSQQNKELLAENTVVNNVSDKVVPKIEETVVSQPNIDLSNSEATAISQPIELENKNTNIIVREVLPKETKYGIAKQYGITVQELEKQNPEVKNGLRVGDKLNILANYAPIDNNVIASTESNNTTFENTKIDFNNSLKPTFSHDFLDQLIERAAENIGTRYRTGGTSKSGFDCSGLMCTTFGAFDIKLPRTSHEQSSIGTRINTEEAQKGDLIFFKTNGRNQINHVGMVVEVCDGEIKFIHSSVSNGVIISSTKEKYYQKNFSQINRVLQ
ncbi:peptidoglycan endopeptidase [Flavobacterium glaciei]|uniref:LysM domain-containing protein n=1 Tax=Flavobacterium glaciei TaxID=386300 RepID=A0A562PLK2_9FLAO|nr:peptidoglycan endopeptidase [Flavobacterium glaciei]RDI51470.1 LysM domain-containing protein [Flavobacterium glaciei]TWI45193.1 LysM domain-containing protein [Flavobacterium glaciei]